MWAKIKALPWIVTTGLVLTAIALAFAGGKVRRLEKRSWNKADKALDLKNSGISTYIYKGKVLAESANRDIDKANEVKERMRERIESMGERDETIDNIAHRFNSKRLRK